jgi:hypothetical protein
LTAGGEGCGGGSLYTVEGRKTLYEDNLVARLAESLPTPLSPSTACGAGLPVSRVGWTDDVSAGELRAHLALLLEVAPGWLARIEVDGQRGVVYRLTGTMPVAGAKARVAAARAALTLPSVPLVQPPTKK